MRERERERERSRSERDTTPRSEAHIRKETLFAQAEKITTQHTLTRIYTYTHIQLIDIDLRFVKTVYWWEITRKL
jgi:hypothetical protein